MALDTDVLIIGAGMSGTGFAVQLIRKYGLRSFEIVEKAENVGGTWLVNTYPGCGCDVASHFYSYSFHLNPDWSQKFSLQSEIQQYFRDVAEEYCLIPHIRFASMVKSARWNETEQHWEVTVENGRTKETLVRRARVLISAVGNLSIPKPCDIPGSETFKGPLFHSAQWDHSFDWEGKDIVVIGNGCSATQFVPVMSDKARKITQFARQAHYLAERPNPVYSPAFKAIMRYVPGAMRLYRFKLYADMEKDFAGFDIESGSKIRRQLKEENEQYVKQMAPERYWDAVIPKHEIGCKRKVMDTDYLASLHRDNVELVHADPIDTIVSNGVKTRNGRFIKADAIILATGFEVFRMLHPMEIIGGDGITLNEYWDKNHEGAAQAYLGSSIPGFKNFFTLMGPNTVTGHLSVIYTVECQINFALRLLEPILKSTSPWRFLPTKNITSVNVKPSSAMKDSQWMQEKLKKLVWASGCTSWALDPKTGLNIAMYPQYQFLFWLRSVFIPSNDFEFEYREGHSFKKKRLLIGGWRSAVHFTGTLLLISAASIVGLRKPGGVSQANGTVRHFLKFVLERSVRFAKTLH